MKIAQEEQMRDIGGMENIGLEMSSLKDVSDVALSLIVVGGRSSSKQFLSAFKDALSLNTHNTSS